MAPRHTQGCGGAACLATALFLVPNKPRTGVLVSLPPPPAYAGIHPTLYLFGFRANALNSHSPPSLPGFDPGSGLDDAFGTFLGFFPDCRELWAFGGPPAASGGLLQGPPAPLLFGMPACSCLADPEISAFPGHFQGRPGQCLVSDDAFWDVFCCFFLVLFTGASRGLGGPQPPTGPLTPAEISRWPHPYPLPGLLQSRPGQWPPSAPAADPKS